MRWLWLWRRGLDETVGLPTADEDAARDALDTVTQAKAAVEARWPKVNRIASALDVHRRENHFADMFSQAMRRRS